MHQGHVSRPISSDLPPHPINDIILKLRVSSSMRSSISSLPLAIYMGPLWSLFLCTVGRYHMCLCSCVPRTLAPSPHCLCAEHTRGRGGREPQKWSQCWKHFYILICVDAHHVHWEDCMAELSWAELLPSEWIQAGNMLPCTGNHSSTCRWFDFTNSCSSDFFSFFLEYLYSFLNL